MSRLVKSLKKIINFSYRRRKLDNDLKKNTKCFQGKILDIGGGRQRGNFRPIIKNSKNWLIVDIDKDKKPDVVASVENLPFRNGQFGSIKATELFEHIYRPEKGMKECLRVLKKGGYFVFSIPFMAPIHGDPYDYQRLTEQKLKKYFKELNNNKIVKFIHQGYMFSVFADMLKGWIRTWPLLLRWPAYGLTLPFLEFIVYLENFKFVNKNKFIAGFPAGYFVIIKKI